MEEPLYEPSVQDTVDRILHLPADVLLKVGHSHRIERDVIELMQIVDCLLMVMMMMLMMMVVVKLLLLMLLLLLVMKGSLSISSSSSSTYHTGRQVHCSLFFTNHRPWTVHNRARIVLVVRMDRIDHRCSTAFIDTVLMLMGMMMMHRGVQA
uniref:Uncharacterized protein n=1 Tax=Anopheles coluzzii TaxID=1518534 RepID=A0A8W7PSU1_ANOCL